MSINKFNNLASASQPIAKVNWSVFDGLYFYAVGGPNILATIITSFNFEEFSLFIGVKFFKVSKNKNISM